MTDHSDLITITSSRMTATISVNGAELQSLTDATGNQFLWNGDPAWWTGRSPILFPIVGTLANDRHVLDGKVYPLQRHGFARKSRFEVAAQSLSVATLRLSESDATLAQYPYRFLLEITYALDGFTLGISAAVTNTDDKAIPVGFGFHPAFLWPIPGAGSRDSQMIEFDAEEPVPASRIDADGLVAGEEPSSRVKGRRLLLNDALFDNDALLFLRPASRGLVFGNVDGTGVSLDVAFPEMPNLGIWTKPGGAPYLCIEPWYGYASPAGYDGSLMDKPGMAILTPGEIREFAMSVSLVKPTV
jgi:galactose mutarotase-like enzyme